MVAFLVTLIARQRNRLVAEVRRQRDEYEHDLILASQVQRRVLPKPLVCPGLELAAAMQPAQLLGGDYYDFFKISDDVVDVVIADVSGHGAAASLLMPSLAVALRLRARELDGPAAIIKDLDQVLQANYECGHLCDHVLCALRSEQVEPCSTPTEAITRRFWFARKTGAMMLDAGGGQSWVFCRTHSSRIPSLRSIKATSSPCLPMA